MKIKIELPVFGSQGKTLRIREEIWEKVEFLFCPNCGEKSVWKEDTEGDYYTGAPYQCSKCGAGWLLPDGVDPDYKNTRQGMQIFLAIASIKKRGETTMSESKKPNRPNQVPWDDDDPNAAIYRHLLWKDARALIIYLNFVHALITKKDALEQLNKLIP